MAPLPLARPPRGTVPAEAVRSLVAADRDDPAVVGNHELDTIPRVEADRIEPTRHGGPHPKAVARAALLVHGGHAAHVDLRLEDRAILRCRGAVLRLWQMWGVEEIDRAPAPAIAAGLEATLEDKLGDLRAGRVVQRHDARRLEGPLRGRRPRRRPRRRRGRRRGQWLHAALLHVIITTIAVPRTRHGALATVRGVVGAAPILRARPLLRSRRGRGPLRRLTDVLVVLAAEPPRFAPREAPADQAG